MNRINLRTSDAFDPSTFLLSDVIDFVADGSNISQRPAPVPPSVVNAIQAQAALDKTAPQNWERGKRDQADHPDLNNDKVFVTLIEDCLNAVNIQGYKRLYDPTFEVKTIRPGDDQDLYDKQKEAQGQAKGIGASVRT